MVPSLIPFLHGWGYLGIQKQGKDTLKEEKGLEKMIFLHFFFQFSFIVLPGTNAEIWDEKYWRRSTFNINNINNLNNEYFRELCQAHILWVISFNFQNGELFFFISWRLITSQHCSGFCHTLTWISHGVTCIPHPNPPSHLPLHQIPLGLLSASGLRTCLMIICMSSNAFSCKS